MRILLVDDEPLIRETLAPFLVRCGHAVEALPGGADARAALDAQAGAVDLVITDVCMPGNDGLALVGEVRERWPDIDVLLITAQSRVGDVREAVEAGAAGFLRKPVKLHELRHLVDQVAAVRADRTRIHRLAVRLDEERDLRETATRERMFARRLHQRIFPTEFAWLPRSEVALRHLPQAGLGGDYLDLRPYGPGRALLFAADVSGRGTPAAFGCIALKTWFVGLPAGLSPVAVLARADALMRELFGDECWATAFCAVYDERTRALDYANAGHPVPAAVSAEGGWRALPGAGGALGGCADRRALASTTLGEDEALIVYSDGLAEDLSALAASHGDRCRERLRRREPGLGDLLTAVLDLATQTVPLRAFGDDISLLALRPRLAVAGQADVPADGRRVLHIEDDAVSAAIIGDALRALGMSVDWRTTWAEADAALAAGGYDLVLLDLVLPDSAGGVALAELRRRWPHLPVLVVTGDDFDHAARRCLDLNPAGILRKPVDLHELDRVVLAALRFDPDRDLVTFDNVGNEWFDFFIASSPDAVELLARYLQALGRQPLPAAVLEDVVWCIREMAMNAIEWGNRFAENLRVRVSTLIAPDRVMVKIADEGSGFDTRRLFEPFDPLRALDERDRLGKRTGGFGLAMVQGRMTRVEFNRRGNVVLLVREYQS